jgi:hypothetical protein
MPCGWTTAAGTTWTTTHFISSLGLFLFKLCKRSSNLNENHPFFVFEIFGDRRIWNTAVGSNYQYGGTQLLVPLSAIIWRALVEMLLAQFQKRRTHIIAP